MDGRGIGRGERAATRQPETLAKKRKLYLRDQSVSVPRRTRYKYGRRKRFPAGSGRGSPNVTPGPGSAPQQLDEESSGSFSSNSVPSDSDSDYQETSSSGEFGQSWSPGKNDRSIALFTFATCKMAAYCGPSRAPGTLHTMGSFSLASWLLFSLHACCC